jgi:hypothetical protein
MQPDPITDEIASVAARLIAEEGLDYASAKRNAVKAMRLAGKRVALPNNDLVLERLREYQSEYQSESQVATLAHLRLCALKWMDRMDSYTPLLAGAVWNGTANEHSSIHLLLFADDEKTLQIDLLNRGIQFDIGEVKGLDGQGEVPALALDDEGTPIIFSIHPLSTRRSKVRGVSGSPDSDSAWGSRADLAKRVLDTMAL